MCFKNGHLQITDIPPKAIKEILPGLESRVKQKLPIGYIRELGLFSACQMQEWTDRNLQQTTQVIGSR